MKLFMFKQPNATYGQYGGFVIAAEDESAARVFIDQAHEDFLKKAWVKETEEFRLIGEAADVMVAGIVLDCYFD